MYEFPHVIMCQFQNANDVKGLTNFHFVRESRCICVYALYLNVLLYLHLYIIVLLKINCLYVFILCNFSFIFNYNLITLFLTFLHIMVHLVSNFFCFI